MQKATFWSKCHHGVLQLQLKWGVGGGQFGKKDIDTDCPGDLSFDQKTFKNQQLYSWKHVNETVC